MLSYGTIISNSLTLGVLPLNGKEVMSSGVVFLYFLLQAFLPLKLGLTEAGLRDRRRSSEEVKRSHNISLGRPDAILWGASLGFFQGCPYQRELVHSQSLASFLAARVLSWMRCHPCGTTCCEPLTRTQLVVALCF